VLCCAWSAGGEIFDQIIRSGYMSEKVAAEKAGQLLSFLAHAHKKHVIHRWVKLPLTFSVVVAPSSTCGGSN
jgi:serine/threonine protein kinase